MCDIEKRGTLNAARVMEIMSEATLQKNLDMSEIEEMVKSMAVKPEGEQQGEDVESRITFSSFLKIVVMHLNEE